MINGDKCRLLRVACRRRCFNGAVDRDQRRRAARTRDCVEGSSSFNGAVDRDQRRLGCRARRVLAYATASMEPLIVINGDDVGIAGELIEHGVLQWSR